MEYMLTFHILNVYVDQTQPRQFKFTFNCFISHNNNINKFYLFYSAILEASLLMVLYIKININIDR